MRRATPDPLWDEPTTRLWELIFNHRVGGEEPADQLEPIEQAIRDGADVTAKTPAGVSMLLAAVGATDGRLYKTLIDAGAPLFDENGRCGALVVAERLHYPNAHRACAELEELVRRQRVLDERQSLENAVAPSRGRSGVPRV